MKTCSVHETRDKVMAYTMLTKETFTSIPYIEINQK